MEYKPTKEIKKIIKQTVADQKNSRKHGCEDPNCDGIRYYQLGGRTLCESGAYREKVLTSYKAK